MRGLSAHPGKMMVGKPAQGFESLTLCQFKYVLSNYTGTTAKRSMKPDEERICQEELGYHGFKHRNTYLSWKIKQTGSVAVSKTD